MGLICSVFHALKSVRYQDSQPSQTALCLKCWPNAWGKEQEHLPAAAAESHNASLETESQNEGSLRNLRGSI